MVYVEKVASDIKAMSLSITNNRGYCVISTNHIQYDNVGFVKMSFFKTRSIKKKERERLSMLFSCNQCELS